MRFLAVVALLLLAAVGAWWTLRGGDDARPDDAALTPGGEPDAARGVDAPERLEAGRADGAPAVRSGADLALEDVQAPPADEPPADPPPEFAGKYDGWKGERMLAESRRLLAQLDLTALEVARPLLAGSAAQDDVGSVPLTSGILVRDGGRRMVLDEERFPELYRLRAEAIWVAQEGGRRIAAGD